MAENGQGADGSADSHRSSSGITPGFQVAIITGTNVLILAGVYALLRFAYTHQQPLPGLFWLPMLLVGAAAGVVLFADNFDAVWYGLTGSSGDSPETRAATWWNRHRAW